jgi:SAM-dependent methyltransferase
VSWLIAKLYDGFMEETEAACLRQWRRELLEGAQGEVLEIGAGTGANLTLYPDAVPHVVASEPDPHMRAKLLAKTGDEARFEVDPSAVGSLRMDAGRFDTVVSTLVMCSVDDPERALSDVYRVLKPGGRLLFLEHVAAVDNPGRLAWQRRIEPIWKRVAGNCHITRDTAATIEAAGLHIDTLTRESMRRALPWVRPSIRGIALKP